MAIIGSTVTDGGTMSTSGGSSTTLSQIGGSTATSIVAAIGSDDYLSLRTADFKVVLPKVSANAPNGYTQARNEVFVRSPLLLDNGKTTINTIRIVISRDVESTDAEVDAMRLLACQILNNSTLGNSYWRDQSLA